MLSAFVGEKTFLHGVSLYLKKHVYANSVSKDLWDGIAKASGKWPMCRLQAWCLTNFFSGKDIVTMMENWVGKVGYPLVTVTEKEGSIHVRQDRFLETGPAKENDNQTIWYVVL
jgi:aminopeptidase 2